MLGPTILEVTEIIIFTFIVIFFIKNYLIHPIESIRPFKNILLIAFSIIILICSSISIGFSIDLNVVLTRLTTEINQMTIELIEMLKHQKYQLEQLLFVLGILQGISLLMLTILFRNIKNEMKNIYANSKKHWDWDELNL